MLWKKISNREGVFQKQALHRHAAMIHHQTAFESLPCEPEDKLVATCLVEVATNRDVCEEMADIHCLLRRAGAADSLVIEGEARRNNNRG